MDNRSTLFKHSNTCYAPMSTTKLPAGTCASLDSNLPTTTLSMQPPDFHHFSSTKVSTLKYQPCSLALQLQLPFLPSSSSCKTRQTTLPSPRPPLLKLRNAKLRMLIALNGITTSLLVTKSFSPRITPLVIKLGCFYSESERGRVRYRSENRVLEKYVIF